ncbi:MAG: hypothetical protein ACRCT1_00640 [Microcoleaceae cyanobacterium]
MIIRISPIDPSLYIPVIPVTSARELSIITDTLERISGISTVSAPPDSPDPPNPKINNNASLKFVKIEQDLCHI